MKKYTLYRFPSSYGSPRGFNSYLFMKIYAFFLSFKYMLEYREGDEYHAYWM